MMQPPPVPRSSSHPSAPRPAELPKPPIVPPVVPSSLPQPYPSVRADKTMAATISILRSVERVSEESEKKPAAEADPRTPLAIGTVVGQYTITSRLGQGGFGITYRARHNTRGTGVVVKEHMPRGMAVREVNSDFVTFSAPEKEELFRATMAEFVEEVTVMTGLAHPGIVPILDAFEANGTAYYVMSYVYGKPMEVSERPTLDPVQRARDARSIKRLLLSLLGTLEYMGQHNVVHRDIKPENIVVTPDGSPVLLDFGSARQLHPDKVYSNIYTPGFCAPEQATSATDAEMSAQLGAWTDLYALGATFSYIITRMLPPRAEMRVASSPDPYKPLAARRDLRSLYGEAFLNAIDRALELEPRNRWQTAAEWRAAIEDGILPASRKLARRIQVLAVSGVCAVAVLGGISLWALRERDQAMTIYGNSLHFSEGILFDFNDRLADIPGSTELQQQLGTHLRNYLRRMEQLPLRHDEKLQRALAAAWLNLGSVYMAQSKQEEATAALRRAAEYEKHLLELSPGDRNYRYELARTRLLRAEVARRRNMNPQAWQHVTGARKLLEELCGEYPDNTDYQCSLGEAMSATALLARTDGDAVLRKCSLDDLLAHYRRLAERYPRHEKIRMGLGYALQERGSMATELADFDTATQMLQEEHRIFSDLVGLHPYRMSYKKGLVHSYFAHGVLFSRMSEAADTPKKAQENDEKALNALGRHIELGQELEALDPHNAEYPFMQCRALSLMVDALLRVEKKNLALSYCKTLMQKSEELSKADPDNGDYALLYAAAWRAMGRVYASMPEHYGKAGSALNRYRDLVLPRLRRNPDNVTLALAYMDALTESAELAVKMDKKQQARIWLTEASTLLNLLRATEPDNAALRARSELVRRLRKELR